MNKEWFFYFPFFRFFQLLKSFFCKNIPDWFYCMKSSRRVLYKWCEFFNCLVLHNVPPGISAPLFSRFFCTFTLGKLQHDNSKCSQHYRCDHIHCKGKWIFVIHSHYTTDQCHKKHHPPKKYAIFWFFTKRYSAGIRSIHFL